MKKLTAVVVTSLLAISPSYAGLITHTDYTSGAAISAAGQNTNENAIVNEINGNLDNNNIKPASGITVNKLESIGATGMVITDSSGFLTTTAGNVTSASTFTITGSITPSGGLVGVTNASNATAGNVGESTTVVRSATNFPTSTQYGDLLTISLAAGDWLLYVSGNANSGGATWQSAEIGVSNTSGNSGTGLVLGQNRAVASFGSSSATPTDIPFFLVYRVSVSGATNIFLKYNAVFTGGPPTLSGSITKVRIR